MSFVVAVTVNGGADELNGRMDNRRPACPFTPSMLRMGSHATDETRAPSSGGIAGAGPAARRAGMAVAPDPPRYRDRSRREPGHYRQDSPREAVGTDPASRRS